MGDSDSVHSGDGGYRGGMISTHLQTMNFKTLIALVVALVIGIRGATLSAREAKAQCGAYQAPSPIRLAQEPTASKFAGAMA